MATIIPTTLQPGVADSFEHRNVGAHIRQLRDGTSEQKLDAAKRLAHLAANGHGAGPGALSIAGARREIAQAGGIEALLTLARDDQSGVQHKSMAMGALANVSANSADNQAAVVAAGDLPALITLVRDCTPDDAAPQRATAAAALGNLVLGNAGNQAALQAAGGLSALVELWREASSIEYDEVDEDADEREWQEDAAAAALRAATDGHVDNLDVMRGLLSSGEFDRLLCTNDAAP